MNREQKLERWAQREVQRNIHHLIIDDDDGGYVVFGRYHIRPAGQSFHVYNLSGHLLGNFGTKRSAMSWCVADKHSQYTLAQSIKNLDSKKQILSADINCRRRVADRSRDPNFSETVLAKLQNKINTHTQVHSELEKCLNSAKYLQLRGFQNETARAICN